MNKIFLTQKELAGIHCLERNDDLPDIGYGPKVVQIYKDMNGAYYE
jgi:hypothetical protein